MAMSMDKKNKRTLYVGGLEKQVTDQVLYAAFVPFGPLKSVQVPMDYSTRTLPSFPSCCCCSWIMCMRFDCFDDDGGSLLFEGDGI